MCTSINLRRWIHKEVFATHDEAMDAAFEALETLLNK